MKLAKDQKGALSPLVIILILILVAIVGFAGWRIWDDRRNNNEEETTTSEVVEEEEEVTVVQPINEAYGVVLPAGWVSSTCEDNEGILFLAPTEELLGVCSSESFGTVSISTSEGDTRQPESAYSDSAMYEAVSYDSGIDVNGLPGVQVSYVTGEAEVGPPAGTTILQYQLYDADTNQTYVITYQQTPDGDSSYGDVFFEIVESFELSE